VVTAPIEERWFVSGPAGTGKTTAGVERLLFLLGRGFPGDSILLLTPQRTLAAPYLTALSDPAIASGGLVAALTVGGLAQRMVELFWPLAAERAGFAFPNRPPTFLTLETAQYYMARLVRPLLDQGYFESVAVTRNRLYSQILDNLNKAALVGFAHHEIGERLKAAWVGEASQMRVYDDVQACANQFRSHCLENNLLDFSLQIEVFWRVLWREPLCRQYLTSAYRHLIADNIEEDTPIAHDLLGEWLPDFDSALLIYDTGAGYRRFLGADPQTGWGLSQQCKNRLEFGASFVVAPAMHRFGMRLGAALRRPVTPPEGDFPPPLEIGYRRYFPEMLDWAAEAIAHLVNSGTPPGQIAVLAPFLPDALRYALADRLTRWGVPSRSHRPSRSLREESAAECLITLGALAHPHWRISPTKFDVAYALVQAIAGLDLVRAQLLTEIVYRVREGLPTLGSFERIRPEMQERITYLFGQRYEAMRLWLEAYANQPEEDFDTFLSRIFGELLAQPGFGFHENLNRGGVAANLVESARKFRWAVNPPDSGLPHSVGGGTGGKPLGQEYIEMVQDGVVAAQYLQSWATPDEDAVLLAPAHTFLMRNQPVDVQFWLDVGSPAWFERLYQPLTQPYVLSRAWDQSPAQKWSDVEEYEANQETLFRLALGLTRRCRGAIYLGLSVLNEQGNEQKGPLLKAIQRVLNEKPA
jgi:hypothetical protein